MARGLCRRIRPRFIREGHLTPVFFGSAINNSAYANLARGRRSGAAAAPATGRQPAGPRLSPHEETVSAFVFKVQANIDPQHRDRIAFVRMCSGRFPPRHEIEELAHRAPLSVQNPVFFLARDRNLAEEAWPGDIIGIPNHGALRIGDTLTEGEEVRVTGLPSFAPEILQRVRVDDPMRSKHLRHALEQLADVGVTRVFKPHSGGDWIIGVVGPLQLLLITGAARSRIRARDPAGSRAV